MKPYSLYFSLVIQDKTATYPEVKPVDLSIRETLPPGVEPAAYIRKRIAEELTRAFSINPAIENQEPQVDPLA